MARRLGFLNDLWRWDGTVSRGRYLAWGAVLFAIKYNLDRVVASEWFDRDWTPARYIFPGWAIRLDATDDVRFCLFMLALALPFVWAGVVLTLRRLRDASLPFGLVILFFIPLVNFLLFAVLTTWPGDRDVGATPRTTLWSGWWVRFVPRHAWGSAAVGVLLTVVFGLAAMWVSVKVFKTYGLALFVLIPFWVGLVSVVVYGIPQPRRIGDCLAVSLLGVVLLGAALLAFAWEGFICILMAAPLAIPLGLLGGMVGFLIQRRELLMPRTPPPLPTMCVALLLLMTVEPMAQREAPLIEVKTSIDIEATPVRVWENVVALSELPPPTEWLFKVGIAYPIFAEIDGAGVGAVRRCVFSTGPFVEPIEVWDEPRLLRFGVTANPPPMEEWTPYDEIHPPHLEGFLESERGQFVLTALRGGGTRLEGTTWYRHNLWPAGYWQVWSDAIIHRIHLRVLHHVKGEAERR